MAKQTKKATKAKSVTKEALLRSGIQKNSEKNEDYVPPLLRFGPLRRDLHVKPLHGELISSIANFLTRAECQQVMQFAREEGFTRATQRATKYYAFRDNDRILLRLPAFAELLWQRVEQYVPKQFDGMHAVGLNPAIRIYRYSQGQRFGCHVDQSDTDPITGFHSRFTLLVYLNDESDSDLRGGSTIFYANEFDAQDGHPVLNVAPQTGAVLLHGHGDRCLLHEGAEVTAGAKYLLRSDVMYSRTPRKKE